MLFLIFLCSFSGVLTTAFFWITLPYTFLRVSQVVLVVKNLPANAGDIRDTGSILGWEDPLEEEVATHSRILTWRIPWIEEPARLQSMGSQRVRHNWSSLAIMSWFNEGQKICAIPLSPAPCPFNSSQLALTHSFLSLSLISVHMPGTSSSFSALT